MLKAINLLKLHLAEIEEMAETAVDGVGKGILFLRAGVIRENIAYLEHYLGGK